MVKRMTNNCSSLFSEVKISGKRRSWWWWWLGKQLILPLITKVWSQTILTIEMARTQLSISHPPSKFVIFAKREQSVAEY